jgi:hypothetical protein
MRGVAAQLHLQQSAATKIEQKQKSSFTQDTQSPTTAILPRCQTVNFGNVLGRQAI